MKNLPSPHLLLHFFVESLCVLHQRRDEREQPPNVLEGVHDEATVGDRLHDLDRHVFALPHPQQVHELRVAVQREHTHDVVTRQRRGQQVNEAALSLRVTDGAPVAEGLRKAASHEQTQHLNTNSTLALHIHSCLVFRSYTFVLQNYTFTPSVPSVLT